MNIKIKEKQTYDEIKEKLAKDESYSKIKDYSKEKHRVITYFEVGKILFDAGKHYGEDIIGNFSKKLIIDVDKKFNKRTFFRMRQFYEVFSDEKVSMLSTQLTWTHCRTLISLTNLTKINYYINQIKNRNLSVRQLEDIIKLKEYERLPKETKKKLKNNKYVLKYLYDKKITSIKYVLI